MSEYLEDKQPDEGITEEEESTVFSAPAAHKPVREKSPRKRGVLAVVSAVLAVAVLLGGIFAVKRFIPEKQEETENNGDVDYESRLITVFDFDNGKFDTVTVRNKNGEFVLLSDAEAAEDGTGDTKIWYLKGIERSKISTMETEDVVISAAKISALLEAGNVNFEPEINVFVTSAQTGDFNFEIGPVLPDNSGRYFRSSVDEKTYIVSSDTADSFDFTALKLADASSVKPVALDTTDENYVNEDGSLVSFDKIEISGSRYMHKIVITPASEDDDKVSYYYKVISPVSRYAVTQNVSALLSLFSSGISVSGVYSLDTDSAALKNAGLDNPDVVITLTALGKSFTYKFAALDAENYAVYGYGMNTIKTVPATLEFFKKDETDYYNMTVYIRYIGELKNIIFGLTDVVYSFDITENPEGSEEMFNVLCNGNHITSDYFQNFYADFVSLSYSDFSSDGSSISGEADMAITITDNEGKHHSIKYQRATANTYNCYINGKQTGKIAAADYNEFVSKLKTVAEDKDV